MEILTAATLGKGLWDLIVATVSSLYGGPFEELSGSFLKANSQKLLDNLKNHRPEANHELQKAICRSYLQATLQICAQRAKALGIDVDAWARREPLPGKFTGFANHLRPKIAAGVLSQGEAEWLFAVVRDLRIQLHSFNKDDFEIPTIADNPQFHALLQGYDLLLQPVSASVAERTEKIKQDLCDRLIADLETQYRQTLGTTPDAVVSLIRENWFEYLCGCFQYAIKYQEGIAEMFNSKLLAGISAQLADGKQSQITFVQVQEQLATFGGRMSLRLEELEQLVKNHSSKLNEIEMDILLPVLALVTDGIERAQHLEKLLQDVAVTAQAHLEVSQEQLSVQQKHLENQQKMLELMRQQASSNVIPDAPAIDNRPQRLVNLPRLSIKIFGRNDECRALLQALNDKGGDNVLAIAAPSGFGKTALLTKVLQQITDGETFKTNDVQAIWWIECRNEPKVPTLFAEAEDITGERGVLQEMYADTAKPLEKKCAEFFDRLSRIGDVWMVFDNFERMMNDRRLKDVELECLIGRCLELNHRVRIILVSQEKPYLKGNRQPKLMKQVDDALFDGLPEDVAIEYLRNEGADCGLQQESETLLREFVRLVKAVPKALESCVSYLNSVYPQRKLAQLFDDSVFDAYRNHDAKTGTRLFLAEQISRQSEDAQLLLSVLAFFDSPLPQVALEALPVDAERLLTRFINNKLIEWQEDRFRGNLYNLHSLISRIIRERLQRGEMLLTDDFLNNYADKLLGIGNIAWNKANYRLALELYECAEKLNRLVVQERGRDELANDLASALINKGNALQTSGRLPEALACYDEAIAVYKKLVEEEKRDELANDLASALINKGVALDTSGRLPEALACYDEAITIRKRLVEEEKRDELANDLASALMNKALALEKDEQWDEALTLYKEASGWREKCVVQKGMIHLLPELLLVVRYRLMTLHDLQRYTEAPQDVSRFLSFFALSKNKDAPVEACQKEFDTFKMTFSSLPETLREQFQATVDILSNQKDG